MKRLLKAKNNGYRNYYCKRFNVPGWLGTEAPAWAGRNYFENFQKEKVMTDFWLAAGPIALAVAGYMISQELGRIRKELHELRLQAYQTALDVAALKKVVG